VIAPGTVIDGRYEILAALGSGGMGEVYRASRRILGDEVAIKVMHPSRDGGNELRHRFLRESRACARLRHPNIVSILDFNVDGLGQPYMVMELLSGPSLREEIEVSGPMEPAAVLDLLTPIGAALQLAHEQGITHRDLKPANIVAHRYGSGERVHKVIDFGLAAVKEATDQTKLTQGNVFMGTVAYAAPEQMRGEPADTRADVYALGVIAYEMLTGRLPFDGAEGLTLVHQTLYTTPSQPGQRRSGVPPALDTAIMRALAKDRGERWQSIAEFLRAMQEAIGEPPASRRTISSAVEGALSRYDLGEMVGRGRLGSAVYLGTHRALGVPVAIRVLRREEQPNWDAVRARFLLEARTLQVPHRNLLQVRDFGEDERLVYVITDYITGSSLRQELTRNPKMSWPRALSLFEQMLEAAAALNDRGGFIVGVNADMIRLSEDAGGERIVVSTAGIRSVQDVLATMREQELRGEEANEKELPYIAPEVLLGRPPDLPSDVFTAGVLFYQMVTGTLPFRAPTLPELIGCMLQTTPAGADTLNPEVPRATALILAQCLLPDPKQRVQSARTLLAQLG
jgi:serine/threonine protein kinase